LPKEYGCACRERHAEKGKKRNGVKGAPTRWGKQLYRANRTFPRPIGSAESICSSGEDCKSKKGKKP